MINIIERIKAINVRLNASGLNVDFYFFGSILDNEKNSSDVDVLVIYNHFSELDLIKFELSELSIQIPLDLYFMTPEEEVELEFVNRTQESLMYFIVVIAT
ncbi:nucleotidyltransferase domain-containing protein [Aliivibrio fischeri]|uniref:nucleotidyltransferase domain-containing protein n=1 Tax=Aliivibrio fischeri TaxID=668 RepID=UPI0018C5ED58|nr:nucleotidyltransferase domain-containing protein [Aliivibrio fischeri]